MIYDLQKASMWKRISAFLFDVILFSIVAVLAAWLLSTALGVDAHQAVMDAAYAKYSEQYHVDLSSIAVDFEAMTPEQRAPWDAAAKALNEDETFMHAYGMLTQLSFLITSLSVLAGFLLMEFAVPMMLHNGQTLGKKIFGIAVMHQDGIRVNGVMMFTRTVLGKYAVETMLPLLLIALIFLGGTGLISLVLLGVLLVAQFVLLVTSGTRSLIHDKLSCTVTVDLASQLIFNTREELIAYKNKVHAEKVAQQRE